MNAVITNRTTRPDCYSRVTAEAGICWILDGRRCFEEQAEPHLYSVLSQCCVIVTVACKAESLRVVWWMVECGVDCGVQRRWREAVYGLIGGPLHLPPSHTIGV